MFSHSDLTLQYALRTLLPYGLSLQLKRVSIQSPFRPKQPTLSDPGDATFDPSSQAIIIRCANDTEISVTHLQQENKRVLGALDFWNGVRPDGLHNGIILKLRSIINK